MQRLLILLLSINVTFAQATIGISPPSNVPAGIDNFNCGVYLVAGEFAESQKYESTLTLYPTTTRRFQITLNKMSKRDAIILNGSMIRAKVQVTKAGVGNGAKFNVLEKVSRITKTDALSNPLTQISNATCK